MARLKLGRDLVLAAMLLITPCSANAQPIANWGAPIAEASARFGIPASWIRRVILAESAGRTTRNGRPIRSRVGAMGLMQLMPGTWRAMRREHGLGPDPDDPRDNILAGTAYLRAMYDRFGYPGLFAAYNAGPGRYAEHLARSRPLPAETVAYVAQVVGRDQRPVAGLRPVAMRQPPADQLMVFGAGDRRDQDGDQAGGEPRTGVFFPLRGARALVQGGDLLFAHGVKADLSSTEKQSMVGASEQATLFARQTNR